MIEKDMDVGVAPDQVFTVLQCEGVRPAREPIECNLPLRVRRFRNDLSDEPIAFAHDCLDPSRPIHIVAERLSYFPHRGIDRGVAIEEYVGSPQRRMNAVASDETAGAPD